MLLTDTYVCCPMFPNSSSEDLAILPKFYESIQHLTNVYAYEIVSFLFIVIDIVNAQFVK